MATCWFLPAASSSIDGFVLWDNLKSMVWCKTTVSLLLIHWRYCSLAQSHWNNHPHFVLNFQEWKGTDWYSLTHWSRVTHICISKLTTIGSDNGLSPGRRQAIIWTNAGILLIGPLGINFSEILIKINTFSFNKMHLKMSSAKWHLFHLGLNELMQDSNISIANSLEIRQSCTKPSRWCGSCNPSYLAWLTHWGRDKMAAIFPDNIFKWIFRKESV